MSPTNVRGTIRFLDRRMERALGVPDAGTVELIYELDEEPEALRSLKIPEAQVPPGLKKGSAIVITTTDGIQAVTDA